MRRPRSSPPGDAELFALARQWWIRGAGRLTTDRLRGDLEAGLLPRYRAAGLRAPVMIWCDDPQAFRDTVADPRQGRAFLPRPVRTAIALAWAGLWVLVTIVVMAALAGALAAILVGGAALLYRLLLRSAPVVGLPVSPDSWAAGLLFFLMMAAAVAALPFLMIRLMTLPVLAALRMTMLRVPRWFDDVSARLPGPASEPEDHPRHPGAPQVDAPELDELSAEPPPLVHPLRGAAVALAPPAELATDTLAGHQVLEVTWSGGGRQVFVDGERVPARPDAVTVGRQGEIFAQAWAWRHLDPAPDPRLREDVEQAVRDCYRHLGLPLPALRWSATPTEYDHRLGALIEAGERRRRGWPGRRRVTMTLDARIRQQARDELGVTGTRWPASAQVVRAVSEAGDRWRPWPVRGMLGPGTTAEWRWARTVRQGDLRPVADGEPDDLLAALERSARVAWTGTTDQAVLLTPPTSVDRGEIPTGSADRPFLDTTTIVWSDASTWHLLGGVRVPRAADSGDWTPDEIAQVPNTEVRRTMIEQIGWDTYLQQARLPLLGEAPDPGNPPHLLQLYAFPDDEWGERRLLVMTNASPDRDGRLRRFAEFVPDHLDDPIEAAAWQYGVPAEVYRTLQRRT